ncbi:MAG: hypothetical protein P1U83_13005 [Roseovarius sp.]|nr:hypothetical protein [Roseovarius sp.]
MRFEQVWVLCENADELSKGQNNKSPELKLRKKQMINGPDTNRVTPP